MRSSEILPPGAARCTHRGEGGFRCGLPDGHRALPHEPWCERHGDFVGACREERKRECSPNPYALASRKR